MFKASNGCEPRGFKVPGIEVKYRASIISKSMPYGIWVSGVLLPTALLAIGAAPCPAVLSSGCKPLDQRLCPSKLMDR